jgi:hypothetical protein
VQKRVLVSPGARFAAVASASTCVSMNRTPEGTLLHAVEHPFPQVA